MEFRGYLDHIRADGDLIAAAAPRGTRSSGAGVSAVGCSRGGRAPGEGVRPQGHGHAPRARAERGRVGHRRAIRQGHGRMVCRRAREIAGGAGGALAEGSRVVVVGARPDRRVLVPAHGAGNGRASRRRRGAVRATERDRRRARGRRHRRSADDHAGRGRGGWRPLLRAPGLSKCSPATRPGRWCSRARAPWSRPGGGRRPMRCSPATRRRCSCTCGDGSPIEALTRRGDESRITLLRSRLAAATQ